MLRRYGTYSLNVYSFTWARNQARADSDGRRAVDTRPGAAAARHRGWTPASGDPWTMEDLPGAAARLVQAAAATRTFRGRTVAHRLSAAVLNGPAAGTCPDRATGALRGAEAATCLCSEEADHRTGAAARLSAAATAGTGRGIWAAGCHAAADFCSPWAVVPAAVLSAVHHCDSRAAAAVHHGRRDSWAAAGCDGQSGAAAASRSEDAAVANRCAWAAAGCCSRRGHRRGEGHRRRGRADRRLARPAGGRSLPGWDRTYRNRPGWDRAYHSRHGWDLACRNRPGWDRSRRNGLDLGSRHGRVRGSPRL